MRIIARLDIKNEDVIKGINFEGLRVVGKPNELAKKYYNDGADELIYSDCVASLYGRNNLSKLVKKTAEDIFIPITTSGNSENIIRGLKKSKEKGAITAGFSGHDGGLMLGLAEPLVNVPSQNTARIQEMHILIGHLFCGALEQELQLI